MRHSKIPIIALVWASFTALGFSMAPTVADARGGGVRGSAATSVRGGGGGMARGGGGRSGMSSRGYSGSRSAGASRSYAGDRGSMSSRGGYAGGRGAGADRAYGGNRGAVSNRDYASRSGNRAAASNRAANVNRSGNRINTGDVNVGNRTNVNVNGGYGHGGWNDWDDHYHPVARGMAFGAAAAVTSAAVGSMIYSLPPGCATHPYGGYSYYSCGNVWYAPQYQGDSVTYVVVDSPY